MANSTLPQSLLRERIKSDTWSAGETLAETFEFVRDRDTGGAETSRWTPG